MRITRHAIDRVAERCSMTREDANKLVADAFVRNPQPSRKIPSWVHNGYDHHSAPEPYGVIITRAWTPQPNSVMLRELKVALVVQRSGRELVIVTAVTRPGERVRAA